MRELTIKEIEDLASRPGARKVAVENFLMSMGTNLHDAEANLILDSGMYNWNEQTKKAILLGIRLAGEKRKGVK